MLEDPHASHYDRVWLAGYLLNRFNHDVDLVLVTIAKLNKWTDYKPYTTERQVLSVMRSMGRPRLSMTIPKISYEEFVAIYETLKARSINE